MHGTDAYEIVLILDDGSVTGNCSCPHGRDGFFCKHLVATGDVDALVAVYAADMLPNGYTHLVIAQELDQAGRAADALEWAGRGLREAADGVDARAARGRDLRGTSCPHDYI